MVLNYGKSVEAAEKDKQKPPCLGAAVLFCIKLAVVQVILSLQAGSSLVLSARIPRRRVLRESCLFLQP